MKTTKITATFLAVVLVTGAITFGTSILVDDAFASGDKKKKHDRHYDSYRGDDRRDHDKKDRHYDDYRGDDRRDHDGKDRYYDGYDKKDRYYDGYDKKDRYYDDYDKKDRYYDEEPKYGYGFD